MTKILTNPNNYFNTSPQAEAYISYKPSLEETSKRKPYFDTLPQAGTTWSIQYKDRLIKNRKQENKLNQT
jgi:hypothetical protein